MEGGSIQSLPILQDAIKRQCGAYEADFRSQYVAMLSAVEEFEITPQKSSSQDLHELVMFCCQVGHFYRLSDEICRLLLKLLREYHTVARPTHLKTFVSGLILMDNNDRVERDLLFEGWFELLHLEHDLIPSMVIKQFVKTLARVSVDQAEKKKWQTRVFEELTARKTEGGNVSLYKRRLQFILISLYVKQVWADPRTANTIGETLFDSCPKVVENAARFLLGEVRRLHVYHADNKNEEELEPEEARRKTAEMISEISRELSTKKTGKNLKKVERMKEAAEREMEKLNAKVDNNSTLPMQVLQHIYDPHTFCHRVFRRLSGGTGGSQNVKRGIKLNFKLKVLMLTICSRLMGKNSVYIPGFFSYSHRYLRPTQEKITVLMALLAEAVNRLVPAEELQETTRLIADTFCVPSCQPEVLTVGINTIREMCARNTQAITPELLADLISIGRESKIGGVRTAAKSLRNLYRAEAPQMLPRKERVRGSDLRKHVEGRDENTAMDTIEGLDILVALKRAWHKKNKQAMTQEEEDEVAEVMNVQRTRLLTNKDFAALKRIKAKMAAAQAVGYSLRQWLDMNEGAWEEMAKNILNVSSDVESDPSGESEDDVSDFSDDGEEVESESEDADNEDSGEEDDGEEDASEADGSDDDEVMDSSEDERERFLSGADLQGKKRLTRDQMRELLKKSKMEERDARKAARHGGKATNRAGISNRVAARNKPMAMVRQKLSVREKRTSSAKQKVKNLQSHIKTLKSSLRQKFRRK